MSVMIGSKYMEAIRKRVIGTSWGISVADSKNFLFLFKLALKHRQGKNHKMRIIAFVGSPVEDNEKDVSPSDSGGVWAPHVWEGASVGSWESQEEALGPSIWGKEIVQNSVFLLGGLGEVHPLLYACDVCHLPS